MSIERGCDALRVRRSVQFILGLLVILLLGGSWSAFAQTTMPSRFSRSAEREIRFQEGVLNYSQHELKEAEAAFREVVEGDPGDAEAWYYLGLTQLDSGRPGDAVASFNQSLRLDPTPDEVRAARATALIREGKYAEAEEDLTVLEAEPKWAGMAAYLRGQILYAQGDLDAAAKKFAEARRAGETEAVPAEFYEGLTYLRMRQLVRARQSFRESGGGPDSDPTIISAARQLDAVLAQQQGSDSRLSAQLTIGYEYDTNVVLLGENVATPDEISDQSDFALVIVPTVSYSIFRDEKLDAGVEATGYFSCYETLHDFDVASVQGGPFVTYEIKDNLYASIRYGYNYVELGHEKFLQRNILTPQLTYIEEDFGYTSGYYQFETRDFDEPADTPEQNRNGNLNAVGIVQGIDLPELFKDAGEATLELSARAAAQRTDGSDYDGNFYTIGAVLYTPLPVWNLTGDIGIALSYEDYLNDNSLDNPAAADPRQDCEVAFSVGINRQINRFSAVRVDYTYTDRDSNVTTSDGENPFSYDSHVVGVRLIFTY